MYHYQRERTSNTGLRLEIRRVIETGRLVKIALARLVLLGLVPPEMDEVLFHDTCQRGALPIPFGQVTFKPGLHHIIFWK